MRGIECRPQGMVLQYVPFLPSITLLSFPPALAFGQPPLPPMTFAYDPLRVVMKKKRPLPDAGVDAGDLQRTTPQGPAMKIRWTFSGTTRQTIKLLQALPGVFLLSLLFTRKNSGCTYLSSCSPASTTFATGTTIRTYRAPAFQPGASGPDLPSPFSFLHSSGQLHRLQRSETAVHQSRKRPRRPLCLVQEN